MAEGDATVMNNFKEQLMLKQISCTTDAFKVALYSTAWGYATGAAPAYSTTNEISGSGYTVGGASVSGPTVTQVDASALARWDDDGTNLTWTGLAANTIQEARLYDNSTGTKWVLILWEIATNSNGGNYTLTFSTQGIMTIA